MKQFYIILVFSLFVSMAYSQVTDNVLLHITKERPEKVNNKQNAEDGEQITSTEKEQRLINFHEVNACSEEEDYFEVIQSIGELNQAAVFTVYQLDDANVERELWRLQGENSQISLTTKTAKNTNYQSTYSGGESTIPTLNTYIQRYRPKSNSGLGVNQEGITVGSYSDNKDIGFKGAIAEILVFNKVLKSKKRQAVASALAIKYGITLINGKDYRASNKESIYTLKDHEGFASRIAAIGRDDANQLYQKQSQSTALDAAITIGVDQIAKTNSENIGILKDHTFLIWADNNQPLILESLDQDATNLSTLQRQWRMQMTGGENISELPTQVQFDLSKTTLSKEQNAENYLLVIDRSGTGKYGQEHTQYIAASSLDNNSLIFNNVLWDTDDSGTDHFSFTLKQDLLLELSEEKPLNCNGLANGVLQFKTSGGIAPYSYTFSSDNGHSQKWESTQDKFSDHMLKELSSGEYTLTITDALGTTVTASYTLESPEEITLNLGNDLRFGFDQETLSLDGTITDKEDVNYSWTSNNGFSSRNSTVTISEPGTYTLTATTKGGCSSTDDITVKPSLLQSYIVYPNQSTDGNYRIKIQLLEKQNITVTVFDEAGRFINTIQGNNKRNYTLSGKNIKSAGLYHVVLQSKSQKASRKLVVE